MRKPATQHRPPTIVEVAKLARVAVMTVSRVINDHPSVRLSTRKRVQAAIKELGYRRNEAAGLLKGQRAKAIGLIVPDLSDSFFATCAHTAEQYARERGFMTLVVSSGRDPELEMEQADLMARRKLAGVLIASSGREVPARVRSLQEAGMAVVAFDRPLAGANTDAVLVENRAGAEEATKHLIGHGHKHIACVGYDDKAYPARERVKGYLSAARAHGLDPQTVLGIVSIDAAASWLRTALRKPKRPTALFSINYRTSVFLLRAMSEQGIKVPRDMALIGFDDFELATVVAPPVTTVGQSPVNLTTRAVKLLIDRIQKDQTGASAPTAKVMLPATLVVRESCGCSPGH